MPESSPLIKALVRYNNAVIDKTDAETTLKVAERGLSNARDKVDYAENELQVAFLAATGEIGKLHNQLTDRMVDSVKLIVGLTDDEIAALGGVDE